MFGIKDNKNFEKIPGSIGIHFWASGGGSAGDIQSIRLDLPEEVDTSNYYVSGILRKSYGQSDFQPYMGSYTNGTFEIYPKINFLGGPAITIALPVEMRSTEYILILTELPEIVEAEVI